MRFIVMCAAALALAGCADSSGSRSSSLMGGDSSVSPRPKVVVVTDFVISSDLVVIDRAYTTRLERKIGAFPTHERKPRTLERVSDEMVATIVATLREAGLNAQPGSEEGVSLSENAVMVKGTLRASKPDAKKNEAGIGGGHGGVTADLTLTGAGGFGRKQLIAFTVEPAGGRQPAATKSFNAALAEALAANKAAPEKLSPDVELVARKIGRAAGDKIVDYAKGHGWLDKPTATDTAAPPEAAPVADDDADEAPRVARVPPKKPAKKPQA
jgi:hypothetical protein